MMSVWVMLSFVILVVLRFNGTCDSNTVCPPACAIYCNGQILQIVQTSGLFDDDKTFIDMKMKFPADIINKKFNEMMEGTNRKPNKIVVRRFVRKYFAEVETDVDRYRPTDWVEEPELLKTISDRHLQKWAKSLIGLWIRMGRKVKKDVRDNPDLYSMVYLPHPVIVPGGRYREYYYWQSYWTILGLLRSEMYETVKGMLLNFLWLVKTYGFVPNGGRIYYLSRSSLPLLIPMFKEYHDVTNDTDFIKQSINVLEMEFDFWMTNRTVEVSARGETVTLNRFYVNANVPRPEAYRKDISAASGFRSKEKKAKFYENIQTACESGWMFSSRWIINKGSNKGKLTDTKTKQIIPVDLNAVVCWNARILAGFYGMLGDLDKKSEYLQIYNRWKTSVKTLLWNENDGIWYDYDMLSNKSRRYYFPSNVTPLWARCFDDEKSEQIGLKVANYLKSSGALEFDGGIPTSLALSGNSWDFPNAHPPLQHIVITGLKDSGSLEAKELAFNLASHWIRANYRGFVFTNLMFEAYDTKTPGRPGQGIDFEKAKSGYGWTNGICLELLYHYGNGVHTRGLNVASQRSLLTIASMSIICTVVRSL